MWGGGAPRAVDRRAEADEAPVVVGFRQRQRFARQRRRRIVGQPAGKHRRLGDAVEHLAVDALARFRRADDRRQNLAAVADLGFARRAHRGERDDVDLGAEPFGARDGAAGHQLQRRLEPVVVGVVEMVGLGRGEQDAVDARPEDRAEPRGAAGAEGVHDAVERGLEIAAAPPGRSSAR